jgi:hypothetical protein
MELRQKIVDLSRTEDALFNNSHFTENLLTVEGIRISWEKARKICEELPLCPSDEDVLPATGPAGLESLSSGRNSRSLFP